MTNRLLNKTVFITGASAGIGKSCAIHFAQQGSKLILAARRLEKLQQLKSEILEINNSAKVLCVQMDVADRKNVFDVVEGLPDEFRPIDVLVNNAGLVIGVDTVEDITDDKQITMMNTNVLGLMSVTQAVLKHHFRKNNNKGHIINISSISGTQVYPGGGMYCATKHAVDALTRTLRMELVNTPMRVTSISPGMVETEFSLIRFQGDEDRARKVYQGFKPLTGDDVAEVVVFSANRPDHVQIGDVLLLPTSQASVTMIAREN